MNSVNSHNAVLADTYIRVLQVFLPETNFNSGIHSRPEAAPCRRQWGVNQCRLAGAAVSEAVRKDEEHLHKLVAHGCALVGGVCCVLVIQNAALYADILKCKRILKIG